MNNQEYVKKIVSYIRSYMEQNNITQKKLESLCKEKDAAVSQGTISNIFAVFMQYSQFFLSIFKGRGII